jgi:pilus assembly protein CpaE
VAVFVNEQGKNTLIEIAPRVDDLDAEIVQDIMIKHEPSGIHILTAPQRPEQAENISAEQFAKVLGLLRRLYAYIVVDTAPALSDITLTAIDNSDAIVLVTTQEIPAIKNARLFLDLLHTMGIAREKIVFTMNKFDKRIAITPQRISENLKQEITAVIPLDERVVIPAVNRGVPFILENKAQPVGRGIFALAESVRARLAALDAEDEPVRKR